MKQNKSAIVIPISQLTKKELKDRESETHPINQKYWNRVIEGLLSLTPQQN